jgi:nitrite reductase/ring-hydroxylating ferredoxin subunit
MPLATHARTVADRCRKATFEAPGSLVRGNGADFDLKTGAVLGPPAQKDVPSYKVVVEGDDIKVEV